MAVDPQYRQMMFWVFVALVASLVFAGIVVLLTLRYVEPLA
jgi:hypothetical protein